MRLLLLISVIISVWQLTQSANILVTMPGPFYSHQSTFRPLWRELSRRGHKITLLTTNLMETNENITQINWNAMYKMKNLNFTESSIFQIINQAMEMGNEVLTELFNQPDMTNLLKSDNKFDLIFSELLNPFLSLFAAKFQCPFIIISTMDPLPYLHSFMGNAIHPAAYVYPVFDIQSDMSFTERLINTMSLVASHYLMDIIFYPSRKSFERITGHTYQTNLEKNASLLFINTNPLFYPARPVTPVTINLEGGLQFTKPKRLPQDLQTYLDESKHGCIYLSFGSTVDSTYLTMEAIEIFRKTFEELAPIRVLWKFSNDTMALKPKNVELRKWIPQHDILRHPNVKLFITQGGLQSMEEAIDTAVPMLGMPFYGDQTSNVNRMVAKEFGLRLDIKTMDQNSLRKSILELIENPKYKKNIARLSAIFKDRPMSALEKAVWWTEYVIRHGTTEHMRSPSADIPLYQYFFLDIIAFVVLVFIISLISVYYSFRLVRKVLVAIFSKKSKLKTA